ncbi:mitochondrial carrier domain-containing protein [Pterulicium gracile]|uniref:Mitochondrial carrier domain-containing protein n=1 Tax=Pterulicium gracile TaxID=1884261 RepID=A0A5C3QTZ3_9AGAR|nr:mitochondrial carrier domain-containing protein [Pterula gracilis]
MAPAQSKPVQQLTPFGAALAGALGGCFSTAVVYPLDVAKTRIQALPDSKGKQKADMSMLSVLLRVQRKEGVAGWYRGFWATMLNTFSQQYAYFFVYSFVRGSYMKRLLAKAPPGSKAPVISTAMELILGAIAGALAQIFTIPVSVIATRQQLGSLKQDSIPPLVPTSISTKDDQSFLGVAREIIREDGAAGLWAGLRPGLVLTANPAITYGVFERLKNVLLQLRSTTRLTPGMSFLIGSLSKTLATVVTYPYIMAKVRIQTRTGDVADEGVGAPKRHAGALEILARVHQRDGFAGWYKGMQAQITKAVLSQALLFMSKEKFEQWALILMLSLARLQ